MPGRDNSEKENSVRLLQEFLRLETGVKGMSSRKVDIAGGATFDHAGAKQLRKLDELVHDRGTATRFFGNNDRVFRAGEQCG